MKILRLVVKNIQKIVAAEITPDGNVIVISGKNAQGKTSVMDAISMALGGQNQIWPGFAQHLPPDRSGAIDAIASLGFRGRGSHADP